MIVILTIHTRLLRFSGEMCNVIMTHWHRFDVGIGDNQDESGKRPDDRDENVAMGAIIYYVRKHKHS